MTKRVPLNGQASASRRDAVAPRGVISALLAGLMLLATVLFPLSLGATLEALIEKYWIGTVASQYDSFLAIFIPLTSGTGVAVLLLMLLRTMSGRRRRQAR